MIGHRIQHIHVVDAEYLPQELSVHTPEDTKDLWVNGSVVAIDTGCGKGGFLTAVIFVPIYNFFINREVSRTARTLTPASEHQ